MSQSVTRRGRSRRLRRVRRHRSHRHRSHSVTRRRKHHVTRRRSMKGGGHIDIPMGVLKNLKLGDHQIIELGLKSEKSKFYIFATTRYCFLMKEGEESSGKYTKHITKMTLTTDDKGSLCPCVLVVKYDTYPPRFSASSLDTKSDVERLNNTSNLPFVETPMIKNTTEEINIPTEVANNLLEIVGHPYEV